MQSWEMNELKIADWAILTQRLWIIFYDPNEDHHRGYNECIINGRLFDFNELRVIPIQFLCETSTTPFSIVGEKSDKDKRARFLFHRQVELDQITRDN